MDQSSRPSASLNPLSPTAAGTRRYRSKAQRPCDVCRSRKVLCNIPNPSRPCQLCERLARECTFVGKTTRRQPGTGSSRQTVSQSPAKENTVSAFAAAATPIEALDNDDPQRANGESAGLSLNLPAPDFDWPDNHVNWGLPEGFNDVEIQDPNSVFDFLSDFQDSNAMVDLFPPTVPHETRIPPTDFNDPPLSIDQKPGHSSTFIGYSNESDPFALNHFPYDQRDEVSFFRVTYRKVSESLERPLHFLHSQEATATEVAKAVDNCLPKHDDRSHLESLVQAREGVALVGLFLRFVFPSLPILSRSTVLPDISGFIRKAPTGLLAGIYALALPFAAWDESLCLHNAYASPSVEALWKITYTSLQREMHFPRISTVQSFLLLLNYLPFDSASVENPFVWSMASAMLAMAQSLGLNTDPSGWKLPVWEIRLRRRLWWAVVVEHTWRSITHGRSSMLREDDWDVSSLTGHDFTDENPDASQEYFSNLCSLTLIADEICRKFFTLRAVSQTKTLETLVIEARPLRQKLIDWWEALPASLQLNANKQGSPEDQEDSIEGHAPLYLAYYTVHILLFRALLRPIMTGSVEDSPAVSSVLQASRSLIRTIISFICGFDARQQSAFWPAFTRHCLAYPGMFSYMLAQQRSEEHMITHDQNLLAIWRKALRTRVQSWPLLRFALVKIDAIYWKGVQ